MKLLAIVRYSADVTWGFLTSHARALLCIAADPGVRLREIAAALNVTERAAFGVIKDLVDAGYVVKQRDGRRNRYHIRTEAALPETLLRQRTVGHLLALLDDTTVTARANRPVATNRPSRRHDARSEPRGDQTVGSGCTLRR